MSSKFKKLSQEDSTLFRETVGPVTPMICERVPPLRKRLKPYPRSTHADDRQVMHDALSDHFQPWEMETGEELLFHRPGLQQRTLQRLRRGQFSVGAELDLHGMTVPVARQAVVELLQKSRQWGITCVRIIHGKGRGSRHQAPVLKGMVDHWLRQRDEVLAFCSARPVDGGTGAIYVLLKRL